MRTILAQVAPPATGFHWDTIGVGIVKLALIFVVLLAAAWATKSFITTFRDEHERHNRPFWTIRLGGLAAFGLAAAPLLAIKTDPWWQALVWLTAGGTAVLLLFAVLELLLEAIVTRKRPGRDSVRSATMPQAIVLSTLLLAAGLIVGVALPAADDTVSLAKQIQIFGVFAGVCFGLVLLGWALFGNIPLFYARFGAGTNRVARRVGLNKFNRHNETLSGAIILGSTIIATGLVLQNAIDGPFQGYSNGLQDTIIRFVSIMLIVFLGVVLVDVFLLHDHSIIDVVVDDHRDDAVTLAVIILVLANAGNWLVL